MAGFCVPIVCLPNRLVIQFAENHNEALDGAAGWKQMKAKKLTELAMLTSLALIIFIVELQIPNPSPIPGVKLGHNITAKEKVDHQQADEKASTATYLWLSLTFLSNYGIKETKSVFVTVAKLL